MEMEGALCIPSEWASAVSLSVVDFLSLVLSEERLQGRWEEEADNGRDSEAGCR